MVGRKLQKDGYREVPPAEAVPLCWPWQPSVIELVPPWPYGYVYHGV